MRDLGGTAADGGGSVTFTGADPILRSHFRIGASMAIPAMGAGVGAAAVWKLRTGQGQDLKVDLRDAVWNVNPMVGLVARQLQAAGRIPPADPIPANLTWMPTVNGLMMQAPLGLDHPMSFRPFATQDGRFMNFTGAYPHLSDRILNTLKCPPNLQAIEAASRKWNALELEDALAEARAAGAMHRTTEEWARHPEGIFLAGKPLVEIVKIGESAPIPFTREPTQPLSGIKVVSCTHVIAGSTASRTLAEYGADVLHIARDQGFEHEALVMDVNVGMRSTFVDLRDARQRQRFEQLLPQTDVFAESFRGGAIERLGFGPAEVASRRPGIIYLSVRCYSYDGPWRNRAGFDMEGLTVSGFTMAEGQGTPRFPPTLVMNDYIAGYLGAAGVIAALRRRAVEGGSYHVRVSLTRAAMWYKSLGQFATTDFDATQPEHRIGTPETIRRQTPYGEVERLAPQVRLSRTPGRWRDPLVAVRGSDLPTWS
ncbi:hypothetical protein BIY45_05025 [Stenotrophomonas sp. BIIR7]|nr:hypothetical protein BIY45_05025 [Stenotrophomonas sp. BIIR7]